MSDVLIFGGTTEGRRIAEIFSQNKISCDVCVATEYGEQVLACDEFIKVHVGRLDVSEMKKFYAEKKFKLVIDGTHPFAQIVSENIKAAFKDEIPVLRLERNIEEIYSDSKKIRFFSDSQECVQALKNEEGNIFLTTGSKELKLFTEDESLRKRIIARVLPGLESIKICYDCKLEGRQIIGMQGPFSEEMNFLQLTENNASILVTKESGKNGGYFEKLNACKKAGIKCFVIKKPESENTKLEISNFKSFGNISDLMKEAGKILSVKLENKICAEICLCGIGAGSGKNLTLEVKEKLENADYIFGAERMLKSGNFKGKKIPFYLAKDIVPYIKNLISESAENFSAAVLFSGDTGFFSGTKKLYKELKLIENVDLKILPGISSVSCLASKTGISYEDARIISLHGTEKIQWISSFEEALKNSEKIFFLTSGGEDLKILAEEYFKFKNSDAVESVYEMIIGKNLSYEDEKVLKLKMEDLLIQKTEVLDKALYCGFLIPAEDE